MTITYPFPFLLFNIVFFFSFPNRGEGKGVLILVQLVDFIIFGKSLVQSSLIGFIAGYSKLYNQN